MTTSPTISTNSLPTTSSHTPLETLLLFRAVAHFGLDDSNFTRIADALQANKLLRNAATYDPRRLTPDALRELFLRVVREELAFSGSDKTPGPDGVLSPASKKRRLEPPPLSSLQEARQYLGRIEAAYSRIHDAYVKHAVGEVQQYERNYEALLKEIKDLERSVPEVAAESESKPPQGPNGIQAPGRPKPAVSQNGSSSSPVASPKPPQPTVPHVAPHPPLRNLQPLLPQPPQQQPPVPRSPVPSAQAIPQDTSKHSPVKAPGPPRHPQNGVSPVLQAPPGAAPFQPPSSPAISVGADGLQRPDGVPAARQTPAFPPPSPQVPAQGQLKWEPPYQPAGVPPRPATGPAAQPPSQSPVPPQRVPQQMPLQPGSGPLQGQHGRPVQGVSAQPQPGTQFPPTVQPPAPGIAPAPKQPQLLPTAAPGAVQQQAQFHPPYQGRPFTVPGQASPTQPIVPSVPSGTIQASATPSVATSQGAPRPGPGVTAPQPRPQVSTVLQAPTAPQNIPTATGPRFNNTYQPPRPTGRLGVVTPTPAARFSPAPGPRTPNVGFPIRIAGGSGTKWVSNSTPSTPRPGIELRLGYDDVPSPAYEPTSPVLQFATLPTVKDSQKQEESIETPKAKPGKFQRAHPQPTPATARSAGSQEKQAPQSGAEQELAKIKEEASTPQPTTEAGDTTADESVTGRMQPSRSSKRKRDDFTPTPAQTPRANQIRETLPEGYVPGEGPKLVLWTRSFNKVCGSAMEQIIHHRSANMFAQPIREKDAPGYHKVVKQPQDLKSIRAAINHGNRAAAAAAAALPDGGDPGTSSVWLPRTEDLVPPRSIINSSQLDRELAHMFANAIMYNPDPNHGPGPAFLHDAESDDEEGDGHHHGHQQDSVLGYKVDEFGVVNDARGMFVEVEKLLSELRSAEVRRNVPPSALAAAAAAAAAVAAAANASNAAASGGGPSAGKDGEGDAPAGDDNDSKEKEVATADEKRDEAEEEAEVDGEEDQQPEDAGNEQEPEGSGAAAAKRRRVAKG